MTYYERHLPHWTPGSKALFITWRLHGSLPASVLSSIRAKHGEGPGRAFRYADRELDRAAVGPLWLKEPQIAQCVMESLRKGQEIGHYTLWAYVVMANHVHALLDPKVEIAQITKGVKGSSAKVANRILGRTGLPFWQDESFDHWVRNGREFERIWHYIENNPVKAGLVSDPRDWLWSSAAGKENRTGKSACPT